MDPKLWICSSPFWTGSRMGSMCKQEACFWTGSLFRLKHVSYSAQNSNLYLSTYICIDFFRRWTIKQVMIIHPAYFARIATVQEKAQVCLKREFINILRCCVALCV